MRPSTLVVFDGQSLNNTPATNTYPAQTMSGLALPWTTVALSGVSFTQLATTQAARLHQLPRSYQRSVLVLSGGQSDIVSEGDSAATALADMEAYADAAVAAGFDAVIALTLTPATTFFNTGDDEAQRQALNDGIRASDHWDAVADTDAEPLLSDPANTTYYADGLHWAEAGAGVAADTVRAVLLPLLT